MTNTNVRSGRRGDFSHLKQVSFPSKGCIAVFHFQDNPEGKVQLKVAQFWVHSLCKVKLSENYKCDVGEGRGDFSHLKLGSHPVEGSRL